MRYLDPKADLTFKKIFGQHKNLAISLLNEVLPLPSPVQSIEYITGEQVPLLPIQKNSIVDVRCTDQNGRTFIVEMQLLWTDSFKQRMLFNASKSYVTQIDKGVEYKYLQPVYALNLLNEDFEPKTDEYYHHYSLIHTQDSNKKLEGLEFVFVELRKFKALDYRHKRANVLWLRFLTEISETTGDVPVEFIKRKDIREALEILQESSFTKAELETYEKYWDWIRSEKTLMLEAEERGEKRGEAKGRAEGEEKGRAEGEEKGRAEGEEKGRAEGEEKGRIETESTLILNLSMNGFSAKQISKFTGVSIAQVKKVIHDAKKK